MASLIKDVIAELWVSQITLKYKLHSKFSSLVPPDWLWSFCYGLCIVQPVACMGFISMIKVQGVISIYSGT